MSNEMPTQAPAKKGATNAAPGNDVFTMEDVGTDQLGHVTILYGQPGTGKTTLAAMLPGKVAILKGELEAKLPGWEIIIAPKEAVQLVKFLRDMAEA